MIRDITKDKVMKICRDEKRPENVIPCGRLMNGERRFKRLQNLAKTKDRKKSIPGNGAKKCCRTDCLGTAATAQIEGCHLYPQSLYLSCLLAS